jgi:hypothetical protein
MTNKLTLCAASSRDIGEPLAGTGSHYNVWFLLEYRPNWHPKAVKPGNNTINAGLQTYIQEALENAGNTRMLFIRQLGRREGPLKCFIAFTDEIAPRVYALDLNRYEDLLNVSLPDMLTGDIDEEHRHDAPLYAVCVHKERDRACGTYGWSVYNALRDLAGDQVWQSTHIGGHRFAGTLVAFPHGTYYGYLDPEDTAPLLQAERDSKIYLPRLRGRSCYPEPVQAADATLRERLDLASYDALRLKNATEAATNQWHVTFADRQGTQHTVDVAQKMSDYEVYKSTGNTEPERVPVFATQPHD